MSTNFLELAKGCETGKEPEINGFKMDTSILAGCLNAARDRSDATPDLGLIASNFNWEPIEISAPSQSQRGQSSPMGKIRKHLDSIIKNSHSVNDASRKTMQDRGGKARAINDLVASIISVLLLIVFNGGLYYYRKPVWRLLNKSSIITCLLEEFSDFEILVNLDSGDFNEVYKLLFAAPNLQVKEEDIQRRNDYIICVDGVYDFVNRRILEHSADFYAFTYVNVSAFDILREIEKNEEYF